MEDLVSTGPTPSSLERFSKYIWFNGLGHKYYKTKDIRNKKGVGFLIAGGLRGPSADYHLPHTRI